MRKTKPSSATNPGGLTTRTAQFALSLTTWQTIFTITQTWIRTHWTTPLISLTITVSWRLTTTVQNTRSTKVSSALTSWGLDLHTSLRTLSKKMTTVWTFMRSPSLGRGTSPICTRTTRRWASQIPQKFQLSTVICSLQLMRQSKFPWRVFTAKDSPSWWWRYRTCRLLWTQTTLWPMISLSRSQVGNRVSKSRSIIRLEWV